MSSEEFVVESSVTPQDPLKSLSLHEDFMIQRWQVLDLPGRAWFGCIRYNKILAKAFVKFQVKLLLLYMCGHNLLGIFKTNLKQHLKVKRVMLKRIIEKQTADI